MRKVTQSNSHDQLDTKSRLLLALFIFSLLFSVPLVRYFVERIENEAKMRTEYERLKSEVERNERCLAQLESALLYVQTDQFVEQWARERERMAKPGETIMIPYESAPLVSGAKPWWAEKVNCRD